MAIQLIVNAAEMDRHFLVTIRHSARWFHHWSRWVHQFIVSRREQLATSLLVSSRRARRSSWRNATKRDHQSL